MGFTSPMVESVMPHAVWLGSALMVDIMSVVNELGTDCCALPQMAPRRCMCAAPGYATASSCA